MSDHELSPQDEQRIDTLVDQAGFSHQLAETTVTGVWPADENSSATKATRQHHSHRGGRSYPEISGSDVSRDIANAAREAAIASGEVAAKPSRAYLGARALLAQEIDARKSEGDISRQLAFSRTRAERRQPR